MPDARLSLARRLAAYSAAAGAALAPDAGAQVAYTDLDPDLTISVGESVALDVDGDGAVDFSFAGTAGGGPNSTARFRFLAPGGAPSNGLLGIDDEYFPDPDNSIGIASRLSSGVEVGKAGPSQGFYPYALVASLYGGVPFYAFAGEEGFAGFRFVAADGELHAGWIRLAVDEGVTEATLFDYAYQRRPNRPIVTGATGVPTEPGPDGLPETHALSDVLPNPARTHAALTLTVARAQVVRLTVHDGLGRSVARLHDGPLAPGVEHRFTLDAGGLAAGVYVVRAVGEAFTDASLLTLTR